MTSRDRILQRLRSSQNAQAAAVADPLSVDSGWPLLAREEWLPSFKQNLTDNHAGVIEVSEQNWLTVAAETLRDKNIRSLRSGQHAEGQLLVTALQNQLDAACVTESIEKQALFQQVDAGFAVAMAGLAETGSLVVATGPDEPRTVSLVPALNLVLLRASTLAASFSEFVRNNGMPSPQPTNLLLISGPSKTADIQQTLAYGAHGPKELIVLLLTDA